MGPPKKRSKAGGALRARPSGTWEMSPTCPPHVPHMSPTCPPPVPHLSPTCNQRTTTDTARDLPLDHQATENARFTVKQPEPQEKREIYGRQTDGRETREIYRGTTRPRKTREICRGTTRQTQQRRKRFETTAFSDSAFRFICSRFGAWRWVVYMGER